MFQNGEKNNPRRFFFKPQITISLLTLAVLFFNFQQCSNIKLERKISSITGLGAEAMSVPKAELMIRRYVLMIDMSRSMISGNCPQDVDGTFKSIGTTGRFFNGTNYVQSYKNDPNLDDTLLTQPASWDHKYSGTNCKIDPLLEKKFSMIEGNNLGPVSVMVDVPPLINSLIPTFYNTHQGNDVEGDRFKMVRAWIKLLRDTSNEDVLKETKLMLVPVTGGEYQEKINNKVKTDLKLDTLQFIAMTDVDDQGQNLVDKYMDWLEQEQKTNLELATLESPSPLLYENDTWFYEKSTMGASSMGSLLDPIYKKLVDDMRSLINDGTLPFAQYDMIHLSDGVITPTRNLFDKLERDMNCSGQRPTAPTCAQTYTGWWTNVQLTPAQQACNTLWTQYYTALNAFNTNSSFCGTYHSRAVESWGDPDKNTPEYINSMFTLIEQLPLYFGAGLLKTHFVQIHPNTVEQTKEPSQKTFYNDLKELFLARKSAFNYFEAPDDQPPFVLAGLTSKSINYKVTNLFLLNPNFRVNDQGVALTDSDGDGLTDNLESQNNTDPLNYRTDGVCLDIISSNSAFHDRCAGMAAGQSCNAQLDSDGDSLNECEEMVLATNPFDFDSDHDGIPDFLEVLYGYNPLIDDSNKDQNSDGLINIVQFSRGLGPAAFLSQIDAQKLILYESNYLGQIEESVPNGKGTQWIDHYQIVLRRMPIATAQTAQPLSPMFLGRLYNGISNTVKELLQIDGEYQLLAPASVANTNTLMAIARMVNKNDPSQIRWKLFKSNVPIANENMNVPIDWSQFKDIKTMNTGAL